MAARPRASSDWTPWAYAVAAVPLVLLVVEVLRGAAHEVSQVRRETLNQETHRLQIDALQRAKGLEVLLVAHDAIDLNWAETRQQPWFAEFWKKSSAQPSLAYAGVVDSAGQIVAHSDPARIGLRLESGWYEQKASQSGPDVVRTVHSALGGDRNVYDVTVPLEVAGKSVGEYHEAVGAGEIESLIAQSERRAMGHWAWVVALVVGLDAAAAAALTYLARGQNRTRRALRVQSRQRSRELSQIGAGLAHEVRNPLHALRINLHTLKRSFGSRSPLPEDMLVATIDESESAIERLDTLMRDLLQFTDPGRGEAQDLDLVSEVRATLKLLDETLKGEQVEVKAKLPADSATIHIDPLHLRQLLMNVLTMAQHRAGLSGKIDVEIERGKRGVELAVSDSGPVMPEDQRARIFEPFQAPDETGSGLGLALVQVYVEEAGGRAAWDGDGVSSRCRLWFPLATSKGVKL
jgi:signal transduction histidine kinase